MEVKGYTKQSDLNVAMVNQNKEIEERALRVIDDHAAMGSQYDQRMVALARTKIQEGFMWLNRSVFRPERISLPDDDDQADM